MDAPSHFARELTAVLGGEPIETCGYFRSHVGEPIPRGWSDLAALVEMAELFGAAASARGFFVALTPSRLLMVVTRAPATRTPLLENLGVFVVPLDGLRVRVDAERLELNAGSHGKLVLATSLDNPHFPGQGTLVGELSRRFGDGTTVALLQRQRRNRWLRWSAIVAAAVVAGLLWGWLTRASS
jgi:hypothetical protein